MKNTSLKFMLFPLVFGLIYAAGFSMSHMEEQAKHSECSILAGLNCAFGEVVTQAANVHLGVAKAFSTGIASVLFWLLMLVPMLFFYLSLKDLIKPKGYLSLRDISNSLIRRTTSLIKQLEWLSIQEKRDPLIKISVGVFA